MRAAQPLAPGDRTGPYGVRMETYPLAEARDRLGQLVAAPIPTSELEELQRLRDAADAAEAAAREAAPTGPSMTHDDFMARLEGEDLRAAAS